MEESRVYKAEGLSSSQLQKFLLLVMGVRFDEIASAFGDSVENDFIYLPYCRRRKGKGWRARFWDSLRCVAVRDFLLDSHIGPAEIPRKIWRVNGFPPESIISIRKTSNSGNVLSIISKGIGTSSPSFDVWVYQKIGQENSRWLGMLKDVGAKLRLAEDVEWRLTGGAFL